MKRFFELAFQQTQVTAVDFSDQTFPKQIGINATTTPLLVQNAQQSFARTMLAAHRRRGGPLTDATTTNKVMMTTALKELYAFLDVWQVDDDGKVTDRFKQRPPEAGHHRRGRRRADPDRRHARPDEPELHALVRPRRRDERHAGRGLHAGSDRLRSAERRRRCTTCSTARSTAARTRRRVASTARPRAARRPRRSSTPTRTSATGRW